MEPDARYVEVSGGGSVFCEAAGSGRPVVLTHDGLLHRETWDAQFGAFARGFRVVRWDCRGYGLSAESSSPYSSSDDLAQVIRSVSGAPATLIGCSFGALLSLECALEHPELVAALVLVGPIVSGLGFSDHFKTRGGLLPSAVLPVAEQIDYCSARDRWFVAPANAAARERLRALLAANPHNLKSKEDVELSGSEPALPLLAQIHAPTLIVVGECDIPDVHAHCGALEAGIAGARRLVLNGSGHLPQLEVPGEFNRAVLEFIR